ncbi:hypothetical protein MAR_007281, partial [Mya arenaria]
FAHLRAKEHISTAYIDDSCLQSDTYTQCGSNVFETVKTLDSLWLTFNLEKSVLKPCQQIIFLGFIRLTVREFTKLIGKLVATEPGVVYATITELKEINEKCGEFDTYFTLPKSVFSWFDNIENSYKKVTREKPALVQFSDASQSGWSGYDETNNVKTGRQWSDIEGKLHTSIKSVPFYYYGVLELRGTHGNTRSNSTRNLDMTIKLVKYPSETFCIVRLLDKYVSRTAGLRMGDKLMISTQKPHKGFSRDTISRWVKTIMIRFGLENKYGPHSTRAASTSTAKRAGLDLGTIIKTAGWTNAHTFAYCYDKEILCQKTVQEAVLSNL